MEDISFTSRVEPANTPTGWGDVLSQRRILVVEDDADIRRFNAEALKGRGYHVVTATDGAEGWEALNNSRFDLMITDNTMPNLSGIELIRKLNAASLPVRVILSSGVSHEEEYNLRLAATLPKPFTLDELLETVHHVLGDGGWQQPSANGSSVHPPQM